MTLQALYSENRKRRKETSFAGCETCEDITAASQDVQEHCRQHQRSVKERRQGENRSIPSR
jgi:hypothetical protein